MAWYYNLLNDNTAHEEYKVLAWCWTPDNALNFCKWAKEHDIECKYKQDEVFGGEFDELIFYDHWADTQIDENITFKMLDEDCVIIYLPWIEENDCFPFIVESLEDFHKEYLWYEEKNNEH